MWNAKYFIARAECWGFSNATIYGKVSPCLVVEKKGSCKDVICPYVSRVSLMGENTQSREKPQENYIIKSESISDTKTIL